MPNVTVYNQQGKEVGNRTLVDSVFGTTASPALIHQVATAQLANRRQPLAHTKRRGDVRGGGKKPWKQKGTGRARAGSIRSPLWKGGGVTFGPRNDRNYTQSVPKKMLRKAICAILSDRIRGGDYRVFDTLELTKMKTKEIVTVLTANGLVAPKTRRVSTTIVVPPKSRTIIRASRNIPGVSVVESSSLNVCDLLQGRTLILTVPAIEAIEKAYAP